MKVSIGIDIGSQGAWCVITDKGISYGKMPLIGEEQSMKQLQEILQSFYSSEDKIHCVVEDLHSIFGVSAKANFAFGKSNGLVIGMLQCASIPYTLVSPKTWQKNIWQGIRPIEIPTGKLDKKGNQKFKIDTKKTSLLAASRLFPNEQFLASERSKVPHNGIVDATLLAEFSRRTF